MIENHNSKPYKNRVSGKNKNNPVGVYQLRIS